MALEDEELAEDLALIGQDNNKQEKVNMSEEHQEQDVVVVEQNLIEQNTDVV